MKLNTKRITYISGLLVILSIIYLLFAIYLDVKERTIQDFNNQQTLLADQAAKGIQEYIGYYHRELTKYSKILPIIKFDNFTNIIFEHYYRINENIILTISRIDADGKLAFTYPPNDSAIGSDLTYQKHIQTLMKTHQPVVSEVFTAVQGYRCIAYHVPVMDGDTYAGSIAVLIPFEDIANNFLDNLQNRNDSNIWMISEQGTELYCKNKEHIGSQFISQPDQDSSFIKIIEKMKNGEKGSLKYFDSKTNQKMLISYTPIHIANKIWSISIAGRENHVLSPLKSFQHKMILIAGILFVFGIVYTYYLFGAVRIVKEEEKRLKIENALQVSETKFQEMAKLLPQIIYETDLEGKLTFVNKQAFKTFDYSLEDFNNGISSIDIIIPGERERAMKNIQKVLQGEIIGNDHEYTAIKKDGTTFPVLIYSSPILLNDKVVGLRGIIVDITDRKNFEEQIQKSLVEKEILLKEIHHRVKNNLNVISSLLTLQASKITNTDQALTAFKESRNRIYSIALVHEQLYKTDDFSRIDMKTYIQNISREIKYIYAPEKEIHYDLHINDILLDVNHAIPCGLILNELITNAFKHAFPNTESGNISIWFKSVNKNGYEICVKDNGIGLPKDMDINNIESLGLNLITVLAKQIDGEIKVERNGGTTFVIRFNLDTSKT